jgi:cell division protein FtsW
MKKGWLTKTFKGDRAIWGLVVLFMVYSLLAVYSSSVGVAFMKHGGNTTYFLESQLVMLLFSLGIIVFVHYVPYTKYISVAGLVLLCSIVLLILTFAFGARVNEATRSLVIPGTGLRIQTSDIAKVALVLYLARTMAKYQNKLDNFMLVTKYLLAPVGIVCGLILPENLSTALMIFGISTIIMFIGGVPKKFIIAYFGIAVVAVFLYAAMLVLFKEENRVDLWKGRIERYGGSGSRLSVESGKYCNFNRRFIRESSRGKYSAKHASAIQL